MRFRNHARFARASRWRRGRPGLLQWLAAGAVLVGLAWAAREIERRWSIPAEIAGFGEAVDGDSLLVAGQKIRLKGVDAPELAQMCQNHIGREYACGVEAKRWLRTRLSRGAVTCKVQGADRYGRFLADCAMAGESLNAALVREGLAVSYGGYEREERAARAGNAGLWAGRFQSPSDWRAANPREPRA
jgi:endonuclease YncB( thermonuclease family)